MLDLSAAPEGATHYDLNDNTASAWCKLEDGEWFFWSDALNGWDTFTLSDCNMIPLNLADNKITVKYQGDKPTQGSELAAGYDLRASEEVRIYPHSSAGITVTTKIQMPDNYLCHLMPRSSICNKKGLILTNSIGLVDPDYTGNLIFNFWNLGNDAITIKKGERIGQAVFHNRIEVEFVEAEEFKQTDRGDKGFGSSGVM